MKTGFIKRLNQIAIQVTEDVKRIFDLSSLDVSAMEDSSTLQLFINKQPFRLPETGSGLKQFLMVLATVAIASPSYVLIDEPELNLHASLQIDFLTTLASYASHGVLFTTHNLGLARAVANRIYSVPKIEMWRSEVKDYEETSRLTEFLGEMSFRGYKDLGCAAVLLVEGPTDLVALQQFLRLYRKEHTTVLLSMRGSNIINGSRETEQQLEEVTRISDNIYALIDSDKSEPDQTIDGKRSEFEQKCSAAGITCAILERRALEHYLSDRAVKRIFGQRYRALQPFEKRESVKPMWSKKDNWKVAREMTKEELDGTDLGKFLEKL